MAVLDGIKKTNTSFPPLLTDVKLLKHQPQIIHFKLRVSEWLDTRACMTSCSPTHLCA